jgi:NADH-quinone oxidoreductase subunit C
MKPTVERLSQQFTELIGPEAFAKARAAAEAAARAAAEAAAKAAAAAAAKPAPAPAAAAPKPVAPVPPAPAAATTPAAQPPVASAAPAPKPAGATPPAAVPAAAATPKPTIATPPAAPKPAAPAAPKPAAPAVPPPPPPPLQSTSHAAKGYDLDAFVAPSQVVAAAQLLDQQGFGLDAVTGVDWMAQNEMEVVYDYFHPTESLRVVVRTRIPRATPELPTISTVFPGANWHERETHDFFGIVFTGHPNLQPFLLPEDATFHPLRKDFTP